jgi:Uma2 family endonuclease
MAALPQSDLMTLEEYLHTAYSPDCEFVDGRIEERNLGELSHSLLQTELAFWFRSHRDDWNIRTMAELRTRVSERRVRIPDVMVTHNDGAKDPVRQLPPLIAIEVLAPDGRLPRLLIRLADFLKLGTENIWVFDPEERTAMVYTETVLRLVEESRLTVANTSIYIDLPELFACLD